VRTEDELRRALGGELGGEVDLATGRRAVSGKVRRGRLLKSGTAAAVVVAVLTVGAAVAARDTKGITPLAAGGHSAHWDSCSRDFAFGYTPLAEGDKGEVHWVLLFDERARAGDSDVFPFVVAIGPRNGTECGTGQLERRTGAESYPNFRVASTGSDSGPIAVGAVGKDATAVEVQFLTGERQTARVVDTGPGVPSNAFIVFHEDEAVSPGPDTPLAVITVLHGDRVIGRWQGGEPLACDAGEVGRYFVAAPKPLAQGATDDEAIHDAEARIYAGVPHTSVERLQGFEVAVRRGDRVVGVFRVMGGRVLSDRHCVKR